MAISALGKSHDERYAGLYLDVIKTSKLTNISASLQAALAYEELGFQVFKDKDSIVEEWDLIEAINIFLKEKNIPASLS